MMIKRNMIRFLTAILTVSCGTDPERPYDNPFDTTGNMETERVNVSSETDSISKSDVDSASDSSAVDKTDAEGTEASSESTCESDECPSEDGTVTFNFTVRQDIGLDGCRSYEAIEFFSESNRYRVYLQAVCEEYADTSQIYTYTLDEDLNFSSPPLLVSVECDELSLDVSNVDFVAGKEEYAATWECGNFSAGYKRYFAVISGQIGVLHTEHIEDDMLSLRGFVSFSFKARNYAVSRPGALFRFGTNGQPVGGPIAVSHDSQHILRAIKDEWIIIHSTYGNRNRCTRVSSSGQLMASGEYISSKVHDIVGADKVLHFNSLFDPSMRDFDALNCDTDWGVDNSTLSSKAASPSDNVYYGNATLDYNLGVILFKTPLSLNLAQFTTAENFEILSESSVVASAGLRNASMEVVSDKLIVTYIKEGGVYASVSKIPSN